jgi:hypothetical protein
MLLNRGYTEMTGYLSRDMPFRCSTNIIWQATTPSILFNFLLDVRHADCCSVTEKKLKSSRLLKSTEMGSFFLGASLKIIVESHTL